MSCHDGTREAQPDADTADGATKTDGGSKTITEVARVVLVGNPNVGKSTLFNALTGSHQRTMNAPGTTVHWEAGKWRSVAGDVQLIDLPGAASIVASSLDERVTGEALVGEGVLERSPDLAVVVANASALAQSLYLLAQVAETRVPVVVALSMNDVAKRRGIEVDVDALRTELGVPVVVIDPRERFGLDQLAKVVHDALSDPPYLARDGADRGLPDTPEGLADLMRERADDHFDWVAAVDGKVHRSVEHRRTWSDRLDVVLLNPWLGLPAFLAVMWAVFQLTTVVAAPLQDWLGGLFNNVLTGWISSGLGVVGLDGSWVEGLLNDGIIAGLATVATFIPPMAIMFIALSLLEDSGYIARAGFVMDRIMRLLGLDGRAFLPLVIGFGCNLPALAATRTLPNARQRLLTGLLIPFSSCTARLTVFIVMANIFFKPYAGTAIFVMYVASVILIITVGLLLRHTAFRDIKPEPFVLSLPAYQRPRLRPMALLVAVRLKDFVIRAGRVIVVVLVAMWLLMSVPISGGSFADTSIQDSLYGHVAETVAPVFAPAGFDDWHLSASLVTGFVAKEVVVGALAQSYAVDEPASGSQPGDLGTRVRATFDETSGGHGSVAAAAFMLFVLAYTPCAATVAEQKRQFGWRPALLAVGGSLVLAWLLAVAVFQIGVLIW